MEKMMTTRTAKNLAAAFEAVTEVVGVTRVAPNGTTFVHYIPSLRDTVRYLNLAVGIEHLSPEDVLGFAKGGFKFEENPDSCHGYRQEVVDLEIDKDGYIIVTEDRCGNGDGCFTVSESYEFKRF